MTYGPFDAETFPTLDLPAVWCPEPPPEDREELVAYVNRQAAAGLVLSADIMESVLRLLLGLTDVEKVEQPPEGYDPDVQGDWDPAVPTFAFARRVRKVDEKREDGEIRLVYDVAGISYFAVTLTPERLTIEPTEIPYTD